MYSGAFDPTFYTYITYLFVSLYVLVDFLMFFNSNVGHLVFTQMLLPLLTINQIFIAIAITVIIYLSPSQFLNNTIEYGGTKEFSTVYVGDRLLHFIPVGELLLLTILHKQVFKKFKFESRAAMTTHIISTILAPAVMVFLYCSIFDFSENYPTSLNIWFTLALVLTVSIITSVLFTILILY